MFRLIIFATLCSVSFAAIHRYRRNEGNENHVRYYRPKYVYKFQEDDSDSDEQSYAFHHHHQSQEPEVEYKYVFANNDEEDSKYEMSDSEEKEEEVPYKHKLTQEMVTHYGYSHKTNHLDKPSMDVDHHVEVKHEHGTSHQSFQMHHFHPAKVFIKKQDLHYLKKPIEVSVTKHKFKFSHPQPKPKKKQPTVEYQWNDKDLKDYEIKYQEHTPKVEYHVSKQMHPKKTVYQKHYPSKPKKYQKTYQYVKKERPIEIHKQEDDDEEYTLPKDYYYHYQQPSFKLKPTVSSIKHTVYRGNSEEVVKSEEESDEVPHDIHVYH